MRLGDEHHLLFCYFCNTMNGKISRVTYNAIKEVAELYLDNGYIKIVPVTLDEWRDMLKDNFVENLNKLLDE